MDYLYITFDPAKRPDGIHSLRSEYVETFWMPSLGPSAIAFLRFAGHLYEPLAHISERAQTSVPIQQLAPSLGLRGGLSGNSRLGRTISRLDYFRILEHTNPQSITLTPLLPSLRPHQIAKLPTALQHLHDTHTTSLDGEMV